MNRILGDLFRHNRWANERLLDACAGLSQEQLNASNPGAFGTIADTLHHLVVAEGRYTAILTGAQPNYEREEFPGFAALKERANRSGTALIEVAEREEPGRILRGVRRGEPYELPAEMLLIQAINHATEHRTNVTTILAQLGVQPPDLDGWAYQPELEKR